MTTKRHGDYAVGWICALPIEMCAAMAMLDEEHPDLPTNLGDHNTYVHGRIGSHNIVIACLPLGVYGTASAASVAANMRSTYPLLQVGLMVGIAGGVPSLESDIRLGDVVVGKPTRNSGGIIQYDYGKTITGGQFEHTGSLNKPPHAALTAMSRLQAQHRLYQGQISEILSEVAAKYQGTDTDFAYPGQDQDQLFDSGYDHLKSEETCDSCDTAKIVPRPSRASNAPRIHYGLIASGNQVMKHAATRDSLARQFGFLCFEMEAAGLVDHFPCAVIRGITDYADSHKNKQWQPYAAMTAAAYTKELLRIMPLTNESRSARMIRWYGGDLRALPEPPFVATDRPDDKLVLIQKNLSEYDHERVHRRLSHKRLTNTTQWFTEHPYFKSWFFKNQFPCLSCTGAIGSGKTMIATAVVDMIRSHRVHVQTPVIFFYCEPERPHSLKGTFILTSFLNQLHPLLRHDTASQGSGEVQGMLRTFFGPERMDPDFEDLANLVLSMARLIPKAVYVLDGIDSLPAGDIKKLLKLFRTLANDGQSSARVLLFSRAYLPGNIHISAALPEARLISTDDNVTRDIEIYIDESIDEKRMYKRLTDNPKLLEDIKRELLAKSSQMFLWVYLQIEVIWEECVTDAEIRTALSNLPEDLEETYHRCLKRINSTDRRTIKILKWVSFASRPLRIEELREAAAFEIDDNAWDSQHIPNRDFTVGCCANLLVADPVDNSIRFAHPSVDQYLWKHTDELASWPENLQQAQLECGELCVSYLSFSDFSLQLNRRQNETMNVKVPDLRALASESMVSSAFASLLSWRLGGKQVDSIRVPLIVRTQSTPSRAQYKFLEYATENWALQTKTITPSSPVWDKFRELALTFNETWNFHPWIRGGVSLSSRIHAVFGWAVKEQHMPLLKLAVDAGQGISKTCDLPLIGEYLPALHVAAKLGHMTTVQALLKVCDVNALDTDGRSALHYATSMGQVEVARLLANTRGAKVGIQSDLYHTPVWIAARENQPEILSILLNKGASVETYPCPLAVASERGNISIVLMLRSWPRGVDSPQKRKRIYTSLKVAIEMGNVYVANELLKSFSASKGEELDSLLVLAAQEPHTCESVVKLLVKKGADVDTPDSTGKTPLCWAAESGQFELVRFLIQAGARLEVQENMHGRTALGLAASSGNPQCADVIRLLVDSGADLESRYFDGQTPLLLAACSKEQSTVKALIDKGADIQRRAPLVLGMAAKSGDDGYEVARFLLGVPQVSIEAEDDESRTALSLASEGGHLEMVKLLIESGADQETRDVNGHTPLALAVMSDKYGCERVAELLLEHGAEIESRDDSDRTPLSLAAQYGKLSMARILLDRGADLEARNRNGDTPLALAIAGEADDCMIIANLLMRSGANRNSKNAKGQTPLMLA